MTTILVIEDEADLSEEIQLLLTFNNYEVISAIDGKDGVEKALAILPDLILCDVRMPKMDGFAVLEVMRSNPATANIPFIFLTALSERYQLRRGMELGADDYISKPFTQHELLTAITTRLEKINLQRETQIRQFSQQLVETQEKERAEIARELQEKVGQILQSAGVIISSSKRNLDEGMRGKLEEIRTLIDSAATQLYELSMELHPILLDHLGLLAALNWYLERYRNQKQREVIFTHNDIEGRRFALEIEKVTYRIVQNALLELAPYTSGPLKLFLANDGNQLSVEITISETLPETKKKEPDLYNLYKLAFYAGGKINLYTLNPTGFKVVASLPLVAPSAPVYQANITDLTRPVEMRMQSADEVVSSPFAGNSPIMLVSLNEAWRQGLKELLARLPGITNIGEANTLADLPKLYADSARYIVILEIDGDDTLHQLEEHIAQNSNAAVLLVGRESDEEIAVKALMTGAAGFILRSSITEDLAGSLEHLSHGRKYLGSPFREQAIEHFIFMKSTTLSEAGYEKLTRREREILVWVAGGFTSSEIAERLSLSPRTVETHRANIMGKLNLRNRYELMNYAIQHGIITRKD